MRSKAKPEVRHKFYKTLTDTIKDLPKRDELYILGDFNAKVGKREMMQKRNTSKQNTLQTWDDGEKEGGMKTENTS